MIDNGIETHPQIIPAVATWYLWCRAFKTLLAFFSFITAKIPKINPKQREEKAILKLPNTIDTTAQFSASIISRNGLST